MRLRVSILLSLLLPACADTVSSTVGDAATPSDAVLSDNGSATPDVVGPPVDAGPPPPPAPFALSDDCAAGTWCWERPEPTGETVVDAAALPDGGVVFITEDGTLVLWQRGRWTTRPLSLPGRPTSVLAAGPDIIWVTSVEPMNQRQRFITRIERATVRSEPLPGEGSVGNLVGTDPNEVWALGIRAPIRWDGTRWTEGAALPGDILLNAVHRAGPGELLVLESWGSGSGYGRLHRYRDGVYTLEYDFRELELRVDGPIVAVGETLWFRGYDTRRSVASAVRFENGAWAAFNMPSGTTGATLHQAANAVWAVDGSRAWERVGNQWVPIEGFDGTPYGPTLQATDGATWVFSNGITRRLGGQWTPVGARSIPALGFLHDDPREPALVTIGAPGLLVRRGANERAWVDSPGGWMGDASALSSTAAGSWVGTTAGIYQLFARGVRTSAPLAPGQMRPYFLAGNGRDAWTLNDNFLPFGFVQGSWLAAAEIPEPAEAPQSGVRPLALHVAESGEVYVATSSIRGDKQVFNRVLTLRGASWQPVHTWGGEFGNDSLVTMTSGPEGRVYLSADGLYTLQNGTATVINAEARAIDLSVDGGGNLVGLERDQVLVWNPSHQRIATVPLPPTQRDRFVHVHRDAQQRIRLSNRTGHILRYTPAP